MAKLEYYGVCDDLLNRPHVLIAGSTGSGKSVLINSILYTLLTYQPKDKQIILIDPKRVELYAYKKLPHCIGYASETADTIALLQKVCQVMDKRYAELQKQGKKMYEGSDIYVIIDEFADLMITTNDAEPLIQRLAQLGRASRIHLIVATQAPNRAVLKANIVLNLNDRIALHCNDPIESRQILGRKGAEILPRFGQAIYKSPEGICLMDIPYTDDAKLTDRINFWR